MASQLSSVDVALYANTASYIQSLKTAQEQTKKQLDASTKHLKKFGKDSDKFYNYLNKQLDKAAANNDIFTKSFAAYNKTIGAATAALAALAVQLLAVQKGLNIVNTELTKEKTLRLLAADAGIAVEELRFFEYWGSKVGKTAEDMSDAIFEVVERMEDASREGGEAVEFLEELNLNVEDFVKLSPEEQFLKLHSVLSNLSDGDSLYWSDKFGDQLRQISIRTNGLNIDTNELLNTYNELAIIDMAHFDENIKNLNSSISRSTFLWGEFKRSFSAVVAPGLQQVVDDLTKNFEIWNDGSIQRGIIEAARFAGKIFSALTHGFIQTINQLGLVVTTIRNAYRSIVPNAEKLTKEQQAQKSALLAQQTTLMRHSKEWNEIQKKIDAIDAKAKEPLEWEPIKSISFESIDKAADAALARLEERMNSKAPTIIYESGFTIAEGKTQSGKKKKTDEPDEYQFPEDRGSSPLLESNFDEIDADYNRQLALQQLFFDEGLTNLETYNQRITEIQNQHKMDVLTAQHDLNTSQKEAEAQALSEREQLHKSFQSSLAQVNQEQVDGLVHYGAAMATASDEEKGELKKRFLQQQQYAIALATVEYFKELALIWASNAEIFPSLALPAANAASYAEATGRYAATTAGIAAATVIGGAFREGSDYIPNDMNARIHEGERIVPQRTNLDLTQFLANNNDKKNQQPNQYTINAPINTNALLPDTKQFQKLLVQQRDVIYAATKKVEQERPRQRRR